MQAPALKKDYAKLLQHAELEAYLDQFAGDGLGWWFNMDIPSIALHLRAVCEQLPVDYPLSLRLRFLVVSVNPDISETAVHALYAEALDEGDWETAFAAAGAGITAVWDSGYDFRRFEPWLERINFLLGKADKVSPLACASVLGFMANAQMNGEGDLVATVETCRRQILAAEEAGSASLRVFHAALQTYCHLWSGNLISASVLLQDAAYLCTQSSDAAFIPQVFLRSSQGLYHTINGDVEKGRKILERTAAHPFFEQLPPSLWLLVQANLLFAIANGEDCNAVEAVAEKIQQRVVPQQNAFHQSFVHFSLGIAALGLGDSRRALAHAEQAIERGRAAHSAVAARMPVLLKIQALADLHHGEDALSLINEWLPRWLDSDFRTVAVTAAQEAACIELQRGNRQQADIWYARAQSIMPQGEKLVMFHRSPGFVAELRTALYRLPEVAELSSWSVRIRCLGEFRVEVGDQVIYDRKWHGGRAKTLLKALVVYGGKKVEMSRLADLLWPDAEGDQASSNLKVLVWRLRRLGLPKGQEPFPWLLIQHGHLSLSDEFCSVDVLAFESGLYHVMHQLPLDWAQLRRALDDYAGDFLPTDNSETWIIEHREQLRRRFIEATLMLADAATDAVGRESSIVCLQRALGMDDLDERLYQRLMRIYLALGYPARALETYHAAQTALARSLAISPGPALVELARQAGSNHLH